MSFRIVRVLATSALVLALVAFGPPAQAQTFTGRIDVTVVDATGGRLPGVNVDLTGPLNQTMVTDARGEAHFLNLSVGTYQIKATIAGFNEYRNTNVPVAAGVAVPLEVKLAVAGTKETVQVTAEVPVIDTKKQTTATNVTIEELQNIPSARDPWVVMQTVPTIIVDRVNVGGSESGQQSNYLAKGAGGAENTWNIDGIPVTDMGATGSTPTYYDFDMFQEMQITTGGADVSTATPGVQLNFVLKSGSNTPHGNARIYYENQSLQSTNIPSDLVAVLGGTSGKGNRTDYNKDMGFDVGGPIIKDRLWGWGTIGRTDVQLLTLLGNPDRTLLKNYGLKINGQINQMMRASYTLFYGNKNKWGRGADAFHPPATTYDQDGPSTLHKGEMNFVFGNNFFLAARGAYMPSRFTLTPEGGMSADVWRDPNRVWHGSGWLYSTDRPQKTLMADANMFRGKHEIKFGFSWRNAPVDSTSQLSGNKIYTKDRPNYNNPASSDYHMMIATLNRDWASSTLGKYTTAYVGDTISLSRATVNLALRYDRSSSGVQEVTVAGIPGFSNILPGVTAPAVPNAIVWNVVSPRVGVTYALDQNHKSQLRASYAMFASQMGAGESSLISAVQYTGIYYWAKDANGDGIAQPSEIQFSRGALGYYGFDPSNPTSTTSVNKIGSYKAPKTHEFIVGLDHELMANFGVSGSFTYRYFQDRPWQPLIGVRSGQFAPAVYEDPATGNPTNSPFTGTLFGQPYSVPVYAIKESAIPPGGGTEYTTHDGYHQRYWGVELSATKRLSNKWMARFGFSTNDHREYYDNPAVSLEDPTPTPDNPRKDGGLVIRQTSGSGKSGIYMVLPKYQFVANGLYQAPYGIDFGVNFLLRQGYSMPYYAGDVVIDNDALNGTRSILVVSSVDQYRLPAVKSLDARVEKKFAFGKTNVIFDLDIFNLFNNATELGRQYDVTTSNFNQIVEIMNPRIMRVGARFTF